MIAKLLVFPLVWVCLAGAAQRVEKNVVVGMYSGLALLMDVYYPAKPNGYGVVHITGSGWHTPLAWDAPQGKENRQVAIWGTPLIEAGYTVFALNHRTAPRFHYPAALEDVQRAVRFIRHNAAKFGVRGDRLGGVGGSSGGHLTLLLGMLEGKGQPDDPDPVNRESTQLQCIVPWAPPVDLAALAIASLNGSVSSFLGLRLMDRDPKSSAEYRAFAEASPIHHVTSRAAPTLIIHGEADALLPVAEEERLRNALTEAGVPAKFVLVPGGGHGADFPGYKGPKFYFADMLAWFDKYLRH